MTQALWGVLLLSLATGAPDGGIDAVATAPDVRPPAELRPANRTNDAYEPPVQTAKAAHQSAKTSEKYKAHTAE